MVVGEAPWTEEDAVGRPFVGRAGHKMTELMAEAGIPRSRVYISNTVRCKPPKVNGSPKPTADVVEACRSFVERELALVRPAVLVLAGDTALRAFLSPKFSISRERGRAHFKDGRWVYPIYHPSYLLRNGNDPTLRHTFEEDFLGLRRLLRVHATTLRSPWSVDAIATVYRSLPVAHTPSAHSGAVTWYLHEGFALPQVENRTVTWNVDGVDRMLQTPSAIQELLHRWTGRPVALDLERTVMRRRSDPRASYVTGTILDEAA